ncbi:thioredoxin [Psychromonas sp. RZ22]|uniref:thioredoxin family protein n=1 Tax=Psychromonas algarum TaxID=2555643 RepID=UPI001068CC7E|nr:thioredoxin family protein [Psychromonas sp. RZ22]TEW54343.1 thioredoxin [Psychromonas sp. RZ22]
MKNNDIGFKHDYENTTLTFEDVCKLSGNIILEFGTAWCAHCQAASSAIEEVFTEHTTLSHIKIVDGKGKRLGRVFKVKLWPTLILLHDGKEVARVVRPLHSDEVRQLTEKIN